MGFLLYRGIGASGTNVSLKVAYRIRFQIDLLRLSPFFQLLFRFSNNRINMYMMINQYLDHIESGYPRILFIMSS